MSVDDPRGDERAYERELEKLDGLDHERDADAIREWGQSMTTQLSTRQRHIQIVRTFAERTTGPLVELGESEYYALLEGLRDGSHPDVKDDGLAESTLRTTRSSTRLFLRDALGREWAEDIEIGSPDNDTVSVEDLLVEEEISRLFRASEEPRDSALLGILLATGQRISAILSLRVGDVDLTGRSGTIHLNDEALGLKGASGPRPLTWATQFVANWLSVHPRRDDPDAPLFCTLKAGSGGNPNTRIREYEKGDLLSRFQASSRLKDLAARADVPDRKVKPHNFRHTAITRMVRDGVPEQKLKWMVGWDEDSSQFKRYQHLDDDEMMQAFLDEYDLAEPEDEVGRPEMSTCPRCNTALRPSAEFCDGCGLPLTQNAAVSMEEADEMVFDSAAEATDEEDVEAVRKLKRFIDDNPDVADRL